MSGVGLRFPGGTDGLRLEGTIEVPAGAPPVGGWPAVVLVLGSYPATRDGNLDYRQGWFSEDVPRRNIFATLAAHLAGAGVASLRYDKRGCGESEGNYDDVDFETLVDDIGAAVAAMRVRPDIDAGRVGLLGQSEGGILVLEAARRDPTIAAVLAQGSPGRRLFETRSDEAESLVTTVDALPPAEREAALAQAPGAYLFMKYSAEAREAIGRGEHRLEMVEGRHRLTLNLDWIRQHLAHPADSIAPLLRCPVAFFSGERDRNVHPSNAAHLAEVCRAAGNEAVTLTVFPGLDHGFRPAPTDRDSHLRTMAVMAEATEPIDRGYLDAVAGWFCTVLAPAATKEE